MAVQPARIAPADLRPLAGGPRVRQTRSRGAVAPIQPGARSLATRALRPLPQAVRLPAPPLTWSGVDVRMRTRIRPSAALLALIIVATMLGLVYVTQVLAAQSSRYAVDRLLVDRGALTRTLKTQEGTIAQWGSEALVVQWAQHEGLAHLGSTQRLKAR